MSVCKLCRIVIAPVLISRACVALLSGRPTRLFNDPRMPVTRQLKAYSPAGCKFLLLALFPPFLTYCSQVNAVGAPMHKAVAPPANAETDVEVCCLQKGKSAC